MIRHTFTFLKKHKFETTIFALLIILYFITRLCNIMNVPMFTDEAIYTRWTQIARQDSAQRFIALSDGKEPLFTWINAIFMSFVWDPLLSGRLVSVCAGFFTMLGLFLLGRELFKNKWIGFMAALLYVIYPFALVYDRLALYDSLVGAFSIWQVYCAVLLVKRITVRYALLLGAVLGLGMLNKTDSVFTLYFLPLTLLVFDFKRKNAAKAFIHWILYACIASAIGYACYSFLRISPLFFLIKTKNAVFIYPFSEWIHHPFAYILGNLHGFIGWFIQYFTWPLLLLTLAGFFIRLKSQWREKCMLFLIFLVPFVGFATFGKVIYPRYIFFMTLPLLILASYTLIWIAGTLKNKMVFTICFFIFASMMLRSDYFILVDFAHAPIPESDKNQLINDWPSGGGLRESVAFFQTQAKKNQPAGRQDKIYIATEGTFGLLPFGLEVYLNSNPNVIIHGFWPAKDTPPEEVMQAAKKMPTYVVFYQPCPSCAFSGAAPVTWPVKLVKRYRKGVGSAYYSIYKIIP